MENLNDSPVCRRAEVGASSIPGWRRHTGPLDETAASDPRAESSPAAISLADSIRQGLAPPPTLPPPLALWAVLSVRSRPRLSPPDDFGLTVLTILRP